MRADLERTRKLWLAALIGATEEEQVGEVFLLRLEHRAYT